MLVCACMLATSTLTNITCQIVCVGQFATGCARWSFLYSEFGVVVLVSTRIGLLQG
jgi:hypothetical protein